MTRLLANAFQFRLYVLISAFALLQFADVMTTNHVLAKPGFGEANPIEALTMAHLGAAWWLPKLMLVVFAFLTAPKVRHAWPYYGIVVYYTGIVAGNVSLM